MSWSGTAVHGGGMRAEALKAWTRSWASFTFSPASIHLSYHVVLPLPDQECIIINKGKCVIIVLMEPAFDGPICSRKYTMPCASAHITGGNFERKFDIFPGNTTQFRVPIKYVAPWLPKSGLQVYMTNFNFLSPPIWPLHKTGVV